MEISVRACRGRHRELDDGVIAERRPAEADGPDLHAVGDRVEEATVMDGEAEDAPLGDAQFRSLDRRCRTAGLTSIGPLRGPGNGRQLLRGASGHAVIVGTEIGAVQAHAMDEAGLAIGDEQRLRLRIESEPAEGSPGIRPVPGRHIGEQADTRARPVDLPDRAGGRPAVPEARHEGRVRALLLTWRTRPLGPGATIGSP